MAIGHSSDDLPVVPPQIQSVPDLSVTTSCNRAS